MVIISDQGHTPHDQDREASTAMAAIARATMDFETRAALAGASV